jgi:hypothetical protein
MIILELKVNFYNKNNGFEKKSLYNVKWQIG